MANYNSIDLNNKVFGEWKVISYFGKKNRRMYWNCQCSCGVTREVDGAELRRGRSLSCGHNKKIDLTNKTFGEWKVLRSSRIDVSSDYTHYWLCECSCGVIKEVLHGNLVNGASTNCGHLNKFLPEIKISMKINGWEVIGDSKRKGKNKYWLCRCTCGIEKYVEYKSLLNGTSTHCGHLRTDGIIPGMTFGRLTVVNFDHRNEKGDSLYLCLCECDNNKVIMGSRLKSGSVNSCGCLRCELSSKRTSARLAKNPYESFHKYNWYFYDVLKNKIHCKSSYEVFFWNYHCFEEKIELEYEPKMFIFNKKSRYTPDFYFPKNDKWFELKGSFNINAGSMAQKVKINKLKNKIDIEVLYWEDIVKKCKLEYKCLTTYFNHARKLNIPVEDYLADMIYLELGEYKNEYISETI